MSGRPPPPRLYLQGLPSRGAPSSSQLQADWGLGGSLEELLEEALEYQGTGAIHHLGNLSGHLPSLRLSFCSGKRAA